MSLPFCLPFRRLPDPCPRPEPRVLRIALVALVALGVGVGPGLALLPVPLAAQGQAPPPAPGPDWATLSSQAEITRTTRGIPHIRAQTPAAAGFALGWAQMEDYGIRVVELLLGARGETARHFGAGDNESRVSADLRARRTLRIAQRAYPTLPDDLQGIYHGFATAVNRWLELHPMDAPPSVAPDFEGFHVLARDIPGPDWGMGERFVRQLDSEDAADAADAAGLASTWGLADEPQLPGAEPGSNTWALGPGRTESGHAILFRNPHLSWTAGYYEGHMIIENDLEFYGDFRIGGPFSVIGGWNARLGWSTTNNGPELSDLYALELDPDRPNHILWDGASVPLEATTLSVEVWTDGGLETRSREFLESPLGPVIHQTEDAAYVVRTAGDGEPRLGEQFLAMMRAGSLDEWQEAMRMQARTQSNFTYADADGNIFYVWNAMHPDRPHPFGGDSVAHPARGPADAWQAFLPFDDLPQLLNPPGGYLRNENDPFHYTNLNAVLDSADYPPEAEAPRVRLRSQHSLELLHTDRVFSLEEIATLRSTEGMLLADRVRGDLLSALRDAAGASGSAWSAEELEAVEVLAAWDGTTAAEARGAVLFVEWWDRYLDGAGRAPASAASAGFAAPAERLFARVWDPAEPMSTPHGLADFPRAVTAFREAVVATRHRWGSVEVAWGAVHRARHGRLDLPVSGCDGLLGCFRVIWFSDDDDGRRRVRGGDGWMSVVEFGEEPRALTVLAYGQSNRPGSPHHEDQLRDFVERRVTPVAWSADDIRREALRSYRPGVVDTARPR